MDRYRLVIPYIFQQWRTLLVILVLTLIASFAGALQPWPLKILIDFALGDGSLPNFIKSIFHIINLETSSSNLVVLAAVVSFILFTTNSVINNGLVWTWTSAGNKMVHRLSVDLFNRLQRLSLSFFKRRHLGDILNRLSGDSYCVYTISDAALIAPLRNVVSLIVIGYFSWTLNKELTLLSFAIAPFLGLSAWYFGGRLKQQARLDKESHSAIMSFVHQTITAIPLVQAFGAEEVNRQKFDALAQNAVSIKQKNAFLKNTFLSTGGLVTTIGIAIILIVGGRFVILGSLTIGSLLVFLAYIKVMQNAFKNMLEAYGSMKSAEASVDRIIDVLKSQEKIVEIPDAIHYPQVKNEQYPFICFENVSFEYERGSPVLENITFAVNHRETVAIVGETGAGKSTLISFLPRFIDPSAGNITIGGIDIKRINLDDLRAHIALVQQEPFLFPISIADNIAIGKPHAHLSEIKDASNLAGADEFIRKLPDGYDTIVGERGATLSGGQRQRISIARALLKNAPILLLDEPTSALDMLTEEKLMDAIETLMKGRTTLVIAHRFSTIQNSDKIVVIHKGKISEIGTRQELITQQGRFHQLLSLQSRNGDREKQRILFTHSDIE
jgi:ATP-binding cassette, subfamily B, bacterial